MCMVQLTAELMMYTVGGDADDGDEASTLRFGCGVAAVQHYGPCRSRFDHSSSLQVVEAFVSAHALCWHCCLDIALSCQQLGHERLANAELTYIMLPV